MPSWSFRQAHLGWRLSLVAVLALAMFAYLQPPGQFTDPDSFYHLRLTTMLRDGGILREFPWTQSALYRTIFIDHHLGYHLLLIPFISVLPELTGLQVATVVFATLSILAMVWCLVRWRVPWWGLGALLLLTSGPFLFRLSLGKAPSLGVGVAFVAYYLIMERRLGWLFWWTWFFTWLYSAWPLTVVMALAYVVVEALSVTPFGWHTAWVKAHSAANFKLLGVIVAGVAAGLVVNPYFPTNLFYLKQLFTMALVSYSTFIGIGAEWYPYGPFDLPSALAYPLLVWLLATLAGVLSFKRQGALSRTSWLMALTFLAYTLRARRQVEYLTPWLVLSAGLMARDYLAVGAPFDWRAAWAKLCTFLPDWLKQTYVAAALAVYFGLLVPAGLIHSVVGARQGLADGFSWQTLQPAATWLRQNTPARSIVFQTDWGTFPMLFYHNSHNYYLTGLDQTFMYEYNHDTYWAWIKATEGDRADVYHIAHDIFGASYLLVEKRVGIILRYVNRDPRFHKVYQDAEAIVFSL